VVIEVAISKQAIISQGKFPIPVQAGGVFGAFDSGADKRVALLHLVEWWLENPVYIPYFFSIHLRFVEPWLISLGRTASILPKCKRSKDGYFF
jgi:hypothetical protein